MSIRVRNSSTDGGKIFLVKGKYVRVPARTTIDYPDISLSDILKTTDNIRVFELKEEDSTEEDKVEKKTKKKSKKGDR